MKKLNAIFVLIISFLITLFLFGCKEQNAIINPVEKNQSEISAKKISFLPIPKPIKGSLFKGNHHDEFDVMPEKGGKGKIKFEYDSEFGKTKIELKIKFNKYAVEDTLFMSVDLVNTNFVSNLLLDFGPHGEFLIPAELDIKAEGLDPAFIDESLDLWFLDENNDLSELMNYDELELEIKNNAGKIKLKKGKIPHFSRYGFVK